MDEAKRTAAKLDAVDMVEMVLEKGNGHRRGAWRLFVREVVGALMNELDEDWNLKMEEAEDDA